MTGCRHDFRVVTVSGHVPIEVYCANCGHTWPVGEGEQP